MSLALTARKAVVNVILDEDTEIDDHDVFILYAALGVLEAVEGGYED